MTDSIGRADYELGTDLSGLDRGLAEARGKVQASGQQLEEAYKSSAERAGETIGTVINRGVRVVAAAAAGVFAIAAKGAVELQDVTAKYRAETGATAQEAERAGRAINEMSGRNVQSLGEIGKTLAKVHTDLGLVGDSAEKTTELFLRYARVTNQDATAAVSDFDDVLDAWNLTAADAQGLMDKLIVSHQKYGGSIEGNQRALAAMAPQLRALNVSVDESIGLLNLFASSGLDASVAQKALNAAIQNLPKGTSLQDFIRELSSIEDPAQRAARASEIFGAQAGPKLANAIRPGVASLNDFTVSADEAAGATERANEALDSSFGGQIQRKIREVGSLIRGLGADWGPALTGASSLASGLAALVGPEFIGKLRRAFIDALKGAAEALQGVAQGLFRGAGQQAGEAFADGVGSVASGAGGTVIGNALERDLERGLNPERNSRLARIARTAGGKIALLWGAAIGAATAIGSALANAVGAAFAALPFAGAVRSAVLASAIQIATLSGTTFATTFGAIAAAALLALPVLLVKVAFDFVGSIVEPQAVKDLKANAAKNQAQLDAYLADQATHAGDQAGKAAAAAFTDSASTGMTQQAPKVVERAGDAMVAAWRRSRAMAQSAAQLATEFGLHADWARKAHDGGLRAAQALAQGFEDGRSAVKTQWESFLDILKNAESPMKERARLLGELTSKELQKGLHSQDPYVRATAQTTKQQIIDRLTELKANAHNIGKDGMEFLRRGMRSKDPDIRNASRAIYRTIHTNLPDGGDGRRWGSAIGQGIYNGLKAWGAAIGAVVGSIANMMADFWRTGSPSKRGPLSTMGGPEGWGQRIGALFARGISRAIPTVNSALGGMSMSGLMAPAVGLITSDGSARNGASSTSIRHGDISFGDIHLHGVGNDVSRAAAKRFGDQLGDELTRQARRIGLQPRGY